MTVHQYERLGRPDSLIARIGEPGGTELPMPASGHGHIEWLPR